MKTAVTILIALLAFLGPVTGQFYLRGEIRDENDNALPNAKLLLHSNRLVYYSGTGGSFGIAVSKPGDSLTISLDGYQSLCTEVDANHYQRLVLKMLHISNVSHKNRLVSVTFNLRPEDRKSWTVGNETYSSLVENDFVSARKYPETGFAIHTDKASYSNVRRFLNMNTMVPPDAVRIEELFNYFDFPGPRPEKDSTFSCNSYLTDCPWNPNNQLIFLHVGARRIDPDKIPPSNLVFLVDISGSMDMPNRLPLLKSGFKLLVDNLRDKDTISIVVYGSTIGVWLPPTSGKEKEKIRKAIEELYPGGPTPGESGIRTAYRLARSQFIKGGNNRVILATDGDFNVGSSSEEDLDKLITQHKQYGIYLTCLGVGMGNYKDSKLEVLAKKGNGNFAYLDNEPEAEKVLVKELTQTLYSVADDAYLSIRFNPGLVREYRLVGYDNKMKALADSLSEIEGGEVGSGHSILSVFEISANVDLHDSQLLSDKNLATVSIKYKLPDGHSDQESRFTCSADYTAFKYLPEHYQFAASIAMFGLLLKESKYARGISFNDVIALAGQTLDPGDAVENEYIGLVEKARKIYARGRRRHRFD